MKTMAVNHSEWINARQLAAMASSKATSINEVVGMEIHVSAWAEFVREDGENKVDFLVIKDIEGNYYSTISKAFIQGFTDYVDLLGDDDADISFIAGKAKAKSGREFITFTAVE